MGRHATVAGRQAASAAAKGRVFTKLARELMVAARGGGDPAMNSRLRLAIEKARDNNMPKDNIERAIKKGTGELGGASYEEITYEGYGPGGTAFVVEVLTDNRNRTNPELRRIFEKHGGNLGAIGSVAWMFKRKGVIDFKLAGKTEDAIMEIALEAGADDVQADGDHCTVFTEVAQFGAVRDALQAAGITFERAALDMIAENTVKVRGDDAKLAMDLFDKLDEQDDCQNVYSNVETED